MADATKTETGKSITDALRQALEFADTALVLAQTLGISGASAVAGIAQFANEVLVAVEAGRIVAGTNDLASIRALANSLQIKNDQLAAMIAKS